MEDKPKENNPVEKLGKRQEIWKNNISDSEIEFLRKKIGIGFKNLDFKLTEYIDESENDSYDSALQTIKLNTEAGLTMDKLALIKLNKLFDEMDEIENQIDELRKKDKDDIKINDLREALKNKRIKLADLLNNKIEDDELSDLN